jgi:hypothetical protein
MLDKLNPVDLSNIQDENARELIVRLMNLIEAVSADLRDAQVENQRLRDENNRLKGEQGKPKIKGNKPKPAQSNYSSEQERRKPKPRQKRSKKATINITAQSRYFRCFPHPIWASESPFYARFARFQAASSQQVT